MGQKKSVPVRSHDDTDDFSVGHSQAGSSALVQGSILGYGNFNRGVQSSSSPRSSSSSSGYFGEDSGNGMGMTLTGGDTIVAAAPGLRLRKQKEYARKIVHKTPARPFLPPGFDQENIFPKAPATVHPITMGKKKRETPKRVESVMKILKSKGVEHPAPPKRVSTAIQIKRNHPSFRFQASVKDRQSLILNNRASFSRRRALSICRGNKTGRNKPLQGREKAVYIQAFMEAPTETVQKMPEDCDFPIQGIRYPLKITHYDNHDDFCSVCLDGGKTVCCDFCEKIFHRMCHMPALGTRNSLRGMKWMCNLCKPKEVIDQEIQVMPNKLGGEKKPLTRMNKRHFLLACKFMLEVYKIKEIPTMKWFFPYEYLKKFNNAPYHLEYLRKKLCATPSQKNGLAPFSSVDEYLFAFKQMFSQAFMIYSERSEHRIHAVRCFQTFQNLVIEYYPHFMEIFEGII